jgi:hypothetical protein
MAITATVTGEADPVIVRLPEDPRAPRVHPMAVHRLQHVRQIMALLHQPVLLTDLLRQHARLVFQMVQVTREGPEAVGAAVAIAAAVVDIAAAVAEAAAAAVAEAVAAAAGDDNLYLSGISDALISRTLTYLPFLFSNRLI